MSEQPESSNHGAAPPNGSNTPWAPTPVPPAPPVPPKSPVPPESSGRRRSGIFAGVVLIAIGCVFLASQIVPGLVWWSLWPLLIVLVGLVQMFTPSHRDEWGVERVMDGIGTVLIGLVLLGNTLGIVSWSVWWTLLTLWPVLLISLGVAILGRGLNLPWARAMAPLLIWAALGYAAATSLTGVTGIPPLVPFTTTTSSPVHAFNFSEPVGGATSATLDFKAGAGEISLHGGDNLIDAKGSAPFGEPTFSVQRLGTSAKVDVGPARGEEPAVVPGVGKGQADVALSMTTVWDATFETGAVKLDADLSGVPVKSLLLKTGASTATLKFGEVPSTASSTDITVKAGASSINILVPRDSEVRVVAHNGLSTTDIDRRLQSAGGGLWQTAGYSSAAKVINVTIDSGISSISVQSY